MAAAWRGAVESAAPFQAEFRIVTADGAERVVAARALPITDVFRYPTVASMAAALAPDDASDGSDGTGRTAEWVSRNNRRREALRARPGRTQRRVSRAGEDTDQ